MHEQKYRYFIDGKEVDNRTDYLNAAMSGDYISYFDGDSVFSVSFNSFFGENKDNNKMIKREVNGHLSDVIKAGQINTREQLVEKLTDEAVRDFGSPLLKAIHKLKQEENKNFTFDPTKPPTEMYITDILDLGQIKGSSTRHKSQNGETHKESTVEERLKIAENLKKRALKQLNITLEDIKTQSSQSYYTSPEKKEEIKADWIDFISGGMKRGKIIKYINAEKDLKTVEELRQYFAEKENKTEELLKDYEQIVTTTITLQTNPEQAEKIKEIVKEFNKQNSAEKTEKEEFLIDNYPLGYIDISKFAMVELETINNLHCIPTDATNIEVFHLDTKDNGDKTAFIGFKMKNGNFSFVEVPFTSPKIAEKENKTEENLVFPKDSEIHKEGTTVFVKNNSGFNYLKKEIKTTEAYKETEGKLFYELDWGFITQMAERMASNKKDSKYSLWNWKKPMTPKGLEDLKQAMWRHILAVMSGEFEDDGREFGHLEAISNNAMMINYQLKNK